MKLLLDTHIWFWWLADPKRLGKRASRALETPGNDVWLSPISIWEFLLLVETGRIRIRQSAASWVDEALSLRPVREAPLTREVALASRRVDLPHQDPGDRFLAATAAVHRLMLVTADERLLGAKSFATLSNR